MAILKSIKSEEILDLLAALDISVRALLTELLREVMAQCERCTDDERCDLCQRLVAWITEG